MKQLLIVGIDPGTTLAYALLDLEGNIIKIGSSKQLELNSLITNVFYLGKPLIAATDVNPAPKFVEKFASQTGAKLIGPRESLKVFYKKDLTKNFEFSNDHERDALAAALFAFKRVRSLLRKISLYVKRYKKEELENEITYLVFSQGLSISDASVMLEEKEVKPEMRKPKQRTESIKVKFDEVKFLRDKNQALQKKIVSLEKELQNFKTNIERISDKKVQTLIGFREKKIDFLNKEIREFKGEIDRLNKKFKGFIDVFLNVDKYLVVKRFKTLSWGEIENKKLGNTIFVDDPSIFSEKSLVYLKGKVDVIIHLKPFSSKLKPLFFFINAKNLDVEIEDKFVLVDREKFEQERKKLDVLKKVFEEYKKEREG